MKHLLLSIMILSSIFSAGARTVKVYKGTSRYGSDVICTVRDSKVYKKTSTYGSDVIANVKDGKVYSGTSSYNSDVEFSFDGNLTIEEFVAVWHAVKYSW